MDRNRTIAAAHYQPLQTSDIKLSVNPDTYVGHLPAHACELLELVNVVHSIW